MTFGSHIPGVQLRDRHLAASLDIAHVGTGDRYLELGSGEGRGLVAAALRGATATGIELLDEAVAETHARAASAGVEVDVRQGDLQELSLGDADVIHMHLGPAFHDLLSERLEAELAPNARVVACGWPVANWIPIDTTSNPSLPVWLYVPDVPEAQLAWEPLGPGRARGDSVVTHGVRARMGISATDVEFSASGEAGVEVRASRVGSIARGQVVQLAVDVPASFTGTVTLAARGCARGSDGPLGPPCVVRFVAGERVPE